MQLALARTSVLLSNYLASASLRQAGKLGPVFDRVAVLPLAGPRMDRLGERGALPAAQMESEIWGHRWRCQLGDWLSKHLSGHLTCQALLAVAPHPALPSWRFFWPCQFCPCPLCLAGKWLATRFRALGSPGPSGAEGGCWHVRPPAILGSVPGATHPGGPNQVLWGFWSHGVFLVLFSGLGNLGEVWGR